jgi:hypothetical protein
MSKKKKKAQKKAARHRRSSGKFGEEAPIKCYRNREQFAEGRENGRKIDSEMHRDVIITLFDENDNGQTRPNE